MQPNQPRHTIRLGDAWEPPEAVGDGIRLTRRFGRPSGLQVADRVHLVFAAPAVPAEVVVNQSPLPSIVPGATRWEHDITPLLRDRNSVTLVIAAAALPGVAVGHTIAESVSGGGRGRLPTAIGGVTIEIVSVG